MKTKKQSKNSAWFWLAYTLEGIASATLGVQASNKLFAKIQANPNLETRTAVVSYEPNILDTNDVKLVIEPNEPIYTDVNEPNQVQDNNNLEAKTIEPNIPAKSNYLISEPNEPNYATSISQKGIDFIKQLEVNGKFSPTPYPDADGFSIGYGHFIKPGENLTEITKEKAEELLKQDTAWVQNAIIDNIKVPLTQIQYDSMFSFIYTIGEPKFRASTLLKKLNKGDYNWASREIDRWNKWKVRQEDGSLKKEVNQGLVNRRREERELFDSGDYVKNY